MDTSVETHPGAVHRLDSKRSINRVDLLVGLALATFALMHHVGRWNGEFPVVILKGDAANMATFAAARDHPELFRDDPLLGEPEHYRFYMVLHIPLMRALARITGDYGSALLWLVGLHVLAQGLGFYCLGRVLFGNRFWAALLSFVTLMPVTIVPGTGGWGQWGIFPDPICRFTFQAILPFLLAAVYRWRWQPGAWPWLLGLAGGLVYVHPVSAPAWAFAIWLGYWIFLPPTWSLPRRAAHMGLTAMPFLLVALPFALNYVTGHQHGTTIDYESIYPVMEGRFKRGYLDIPFVLKQYVVELTRQGILPLSLVGIVATFRLRRCEWKSPALLGVWLVGISVVSVLIPLIEQAVCRAWRMIPLELDLIRGIRYMIPIMMIACLWPLAELSGKLANPRRRWAPALVGLLLVAGWSYWHRPAYVLDALQSWTEGHFIRSEPNHPEVVEMLAAVRRLTLPGSRILPAGRCYGMQIRTFALRPVVHEWKDGGALAYTDHAGLLRWQHTDDALRAILSRKVSPETKLALLVELARECRADYLLIKFPVDRARALACGARPVFSNGSYTLLEVLSQTAPSDASSENGSPQARRNAPS
jgi:hypothetical protein